MTFHSEATFFEALFKRLKQHGGEKHRVQKCGPRHERRIDSHGLAASVDAPAPRGSMRRFV